MKNLILTVGLPRSGKSTWAMKQGMPVVNPDSVRLAIHGQRYLERAEPMVWTVVKYMVDALFIAGHTTVIVDATNIERKARDFWSVFAKGRDLKLVYAINKTSASVCIERAKERNDEEIIPVIERMDQEAEWPDTDTNEAAGFFWVW